METLEVKKATVDIKKATFDDIVFENRNKNYGGYDLRKRYGKTILLAFLIASVTLTSIFLIRLYLQTLEKPIVIAKPEEKKVVEMVDVAIDPKTPPPPPLPQIEIPKIETVKFVPIEVAKTDQEVKEEKVATQKQLENTTAGTQNQDGVKDTSGTMSLNNVGPGKLGGIEDGQEKEDIWLGPVTKEANFDGGHVKYIQTHVSPSLLEYIADRGIKGTITFFAIIDKEGKVRDVSVLKGQEIGNCPRCTEEVKRIIETMPSWIPAENNGMKVMRRISVRIKF